MKKRFVCNGVAFTLSGEFVQLKEEQRKNTIYNYLEIRDYNCIDLAKLKGL